MRFLLLLLLTASVASARNRAILSAGVAAPSGEITLSSVTNWAMVGTTTHSIEFTVSGENTYLLLAVSLAGTDDILGVTWNGDSLTTITNAEFSPATSIRVSLLELVNPDAGTHTLTVTATEGTDLDSMYSLSLWTGVNQSTPYGGLVGNESSEFGADSPTELTVASAVGERVVSAAAVYLSDAPLAVAPQTIICSTNIGTSSLGVAYTNSTGASISAPYEYEELGRLWIEAGISLKGL